MGLSFISIVCAVRVMPPDFIEGFDTPCADGEGSILMIEPIHFALLVPKPALMPLIFRQVSRA